MPDRSHGNCFDTDPLRPAGGAPAVVAPKVHVALQNGAGLVVFGSLTGTCAAVASRFARAGDATWAAYPAISGLAVVGGAAESAPPSAASVSSGWVASRSGR